MRTLKWFVGSLALCGLIGLPAGASAAPSDEDQSPEHDTSEPFVFECHLPFAAIAPALLDATFSTRKWPNGTVPFQFDANVTLQNRNIARAAMAEIEAAANIRFIPRVSQIAHVHIRDGDTNKSSFIGYNYVRVTVTMSDWHHNVMLHELMHAIGFYHEHQRPDRNDFVTINWSNIPLAVQDNFLLLPLATTAGPYDFDSIMHYSRCGGTSCSACSSQCQTITTLPQFSEFQLTMGTGNQLSPLDIHGLRSVYSHDHWRFVDPSATGFSGSGTGYNPWREAVTALTSAPSGSRVFIMPGEYSAAGVWQTPMTLEAPIGGVVMGN